MVASVSASHQDGCNLAMVCKALFQSVMPQLWRTVVGVERLLRLITGAVVIQEYSGTNKKITVTISKLALDESWKRYWVYSPHVTTLRMLLLESILHVDGWDILFAKHKEFEVPLLPNLECLDTGQPTVMFDRLDHLALFTLFFSPSIRRLNLQDCRTSHPNSDSSILGPKFHSLSALLVVNRFAASRGIVLPPPYNCPTERMIASSSLGVHEGCLSWFEGLPVSTNLTGLLINISAVAVGSGEGLIVLGHLPHLEDLGILGSNSYRHSFSQRELLPIPAGLFPQLRTLRLTSMPSTRLLYHIWNSEAMASKLAEVFIHLSHEITWDELESQMVPSLSNGCPSLRYACLFIRLNTVGHDESPLKPLSVLLSRLPIPSLSLYTGYGNWRNQNIPYSLHNQVFPFLKHLDLFASLYRSELKSLAASLPGLRHISVYLAFEKFEDADMVENGLHRSVLLQPMLVHIHYKSYSQPPDPHANYLEENRPQITCFIKSIWPNMSYLGFGDEKCLHNYGESGMMAI
ncbi:unnamed protein product [Rhizoctonia solani]|uniref:Uncharacterized protein n=1 Tax=Rhizoctonia solani TaxID=456999 RepID=A0A8H3GT20_9AGAM|nr:unnamed protein product [Rhizoctonia solani]